MDLDGLPPPPVGILCVFFVLCSVAGCDCGGDTPPSGGGRPGRSMRQRGRVPSRARLHRRVCTELPDGSVVLPDGRVECEPSHACRSGALCCGADEECVDGVYCSPVCTNARCGDNHLTCCADGQVCLDEVVCAADCGADRTVCGASLEACCDAGQVCTHDECVTPGEECGDDYDCLTPGTYCEHVIGRCLPQPPPPLCELRPDFDRIALEVEWHWEGVTIGSVTYSNVSATPAVGDVSGDGIPDVVVSVYGASSSNTILVALSGDDGSLLWSIGGADAPHEFGGVALGNLDPSDDALEIVYKRRTGGLRVVDGDGVTTLADLTTGSAAAIRIAAPSLADMDHDGNIEVVVGCHIASFEPMGAGWTLRTRFDGGQCAEPSQTFQATPIANLDDDPELEITTGGLAYKLDGTLLWPASASGAAHGLVAVADLDVDGKPEVITVRSGTVVVRDGATGVVRIGPGGTWYDATVPIPGGGNGGAPTVADFDGDGKPEIASAGQGAYAVYDPDCLAAPPRAGGDCAPATTNLLRWSAPTQDISSSVTGSSVFDFQGDGVNEVVYNDECWLHVYDGRTGDDVLMEPRPNSSRTAVEYPLVVDVDRDGNSEIVVPANNDQAVSRDNCDDAYAAAFGVGDRGSAGGVQDGHARRVCLRGSGGSLGAHASGVERVRVPRDERRRTRRDPDDRGGQLDRARAQRLPDQRAGRGRVQRAEHDGGARGRGAVRGVRGALVGDRDERGQPRRPGGRRRGDRADRARARARDRDHDDEPPAAARRERAHHRDGDR